jgi:biopolymer transport protein ExbB
MTPRGFLELIEQGGVVMYPLLLCSVLVVGVVIERLWTLARLPQQSAALARHVREALREGKLAEASALCRGSQAALAEVLRGAMAQHGKPREAVERAALRQLGEVTRSLRRRIWLLGTVGSLAPFIGLFGTVIGIIRAFENMAATGSGGFAVVAAGISEALIATAGGLLVGVLSIFAYNAFNVRINALGAQMREAADEILQLLAELPAHEGSVPRVVQSR